MCGFLGIQQCFSEELSEHVETLFTVQALGSHGIVLSGFDGRLLPLQPLVRHNPAYKLGKIVDLLVDEGRPHPERGRISESRAMRWRGNDARRPSGLRQVGP